MKIDYRVIPHSEQRYPTSGDWWWESDTLHVRVSDMGNEYYEWFVGGHEIDEAMMCKKCGIGESAITEFDKKFESLRNMFPDMIGDQEPGDMVSAPYHDQHESATYLEMERCEEFDENWSNYSEIVNNL